MRTNIVIDDDLMRDALKAPAALVDRWLAPRTRFNVAIDSTRAVGTWSLPLPEFKSVAAMLDASVNDLLRHVAISKIQ